MIKHDKTGEMITFRDYVGYGEYKGMGFELSISARPDGTLLGMPVISWDDPMRTTVAFEMEDVIPAAYDFAFAHEGERAEE